MRTGGQILVDQLARQGAGAAYLVPGESFLAVLDALFDTSDVRTIVCRHEGGAAMMAEAAGRLTGRPGIAFVTRAPVLRMLFRRLCRRAGADADDPVRRAAAARTGSSHRIPGFRSRGPIRRHGKTR